MKYVVQIGDEYVASCSVWALAMTEDIFDAALYGLILAMEVASQVNGKVVEFKD